MTMLRTARLRLAVAALLALVLVAPAGAFTVAGWPQDGSDLAPDPAVQFDRLANGLRVAIAPNAEPPGRASIRLVVLAGSLMEAPNERGLAHFLEHMAFNGTLHYPGDALVEYFQRLGMAFGADTNARTGYDSTVYSLELPDTEPATLDAAFTYLRDIAVGIRLRPEAIDAERGIIQAEKTARETPRQRSGEALTDFLLAGSRYPERRVIGDPKVIASADRADFLGFYRRWYTPDRLAVVVVGDVAPAAVRARVEAFLGDLGGRSPPDPALDLTVASGTRAAVHVDADLPTVTVLLMSQSPAAALPQTRASLVEFLHRDMVGTMLTRRLGAIAREPGAPHADGQAGLQAFAHGYDTAMVVVSGNDPARWQALVSVAELELRRALLHGFTGSEIAEARARLRRQLEAAARTASTRQSQAIAEGLVSSLEDGHVYTHPDLDLEIGEAAIASFDAAAARRALDGMWRTGNRRLFVTGPLPAGVDAAAALAAHHASSLRAAVAPTERTAEAFAYTDFGAPGEVVERTRLDDLDITRLRFANGVTVNIKPTTLEADTIHVYARIAGGAATLAPERAALADLAGAALVPGGLEAHASEALAALFAGSRVEVDFGVDYDGFVLGGRTSPGDLLDQLRLIAAYLVAPGFRDDGMRVARQELETAQARALRSMSGTLGDRVRRHLHGGDPRFGLADAGQLARLGVDDLRDWLAPMLARAPLEVTLVGAIDEAAATAAVAGTLGALAPRDAQAPPLHADRPHFPPPGPAVTLDYRGDGDQAAAVVAWPAPDRLDPVVGQRILVLGAVLEDRIRLELREARGKTYGYNVDHDWVDGAPGYGALTALAVVSAADAAEAATVLAELGTALGRAGPDDDEVQRARAPLVSRVREAMRSNAFWAHALADSGAHPRKLAWLRTLPRLGEVSASEVAVTARELLGAGPPRTVLVLPR